MDVLTMLRFDQSTSCPAWEVCPGPAECPVMGHSNRLISQLNSDHLEKLSQVSTDSELH